jgi:NADH:ubiquinone oxidoreductase subunit H
LFGPLGAICTTVLARIWIILRATLPRYRYDLLMRTAWKTYLPGALGVISVFRLVLIF